MRKAKQAEPRPIRNPFYERIQATGIRLVAPREGFDRPTSNPFYQRIQRAGGLTLRQGRGRPRKGAEVGETVPKSVRLPVDAWQRVDAKAKREGKTRHAALREAILQWLEPSRGR